MKRNRVRAVLAVAAVLLAIAALLIVDAALVASDWVSSAMLMEMLG